MKALLHGVFTSLRPGTDIWLFEAKSQSQTMVKSPRKRDDMSKSPAQNGVRAMTIHIVHVLVLYQQTANFQRIKARTVCIKDSTCSQFWHNSWYRVHIVKLCLKGELFQGPNNFATVWAQSFPDVRAIFIAFQKYPSCATCESLTLLPLTCFDGFKTDSSIK